MREMAPQFQIPWSIPTEAEDIPIVPTTSGTMLVLAVLAMLPFLVAACDDGS